MAKTILALLAVALTSLGGSVVADTTKTAAKPDRMLLQWTSQQQMNWDVRIKTQGFRLLAVPLAAHDAGEAQKVTIAPDGDSLAIESVTGWSTSSAIVEIERGKTGSVSVDVRDRYVKDRHTTGQFSLADLQQDQVITIHSKAWPIRNCTLRLTMNPVEVEQEATILRGLGTDRKRNAACLAACADTIEPPTVSKTKQLNVAFRSAAACTGGCNHGAADPGGWDKAIGIYQLIIDRNKGTDAALDAMWAQASCYACWSPQIRGCDKDGVGKGDWKAACKLYQKLYEISTSPSDKADALRRMAEVQCLIGDDWYAGLRTYRKIAEDYPGSLPPSNRWTYRTCAPHCGTEQLAWDIYRAIVSNASDSREVKAAFDDCFGKVKGNRHVDELALLVQGASARK